MNGAGVQPRDSLDTPLITCSPIASRAPFNVLEAGKTVTPCNLLVDGVLSLAVAVARRVLFAS
jgi:hypothetical protein